MQTTLPGLEQDTLPFAQLPPVDGEPEEVGGYEGAAEEAPAGADGATEEPMAEEAPAGAEGAALEGAELPVMVCMVVTVRMPPEGLREPLGCAEAAGEEAAGAELLPGAAEPPYDGAGPPPPTGAPS